MNISFFLMELGKWGVKAEGVEGGEGKNGSIP
jgi:hypothetical protein